MPPSSFILSFLIHYAFDLTLPQWSPPLPHIHWTALHIYAICGFRLLSFPLLSYPQPLFYILCYCDLDSLLGLVSLSHIHFSYSCLNVLLFVIVCLHVCMYRWMDVYLSFCIYWSLYLTILYRNQIIFVLIAITFLLASYFLFVWMPPLSFWLTLSFLYHMAISSGLTVS